MNYLWPVTSSVTVKNFLGTGITLFKEKFGALSQESDNIYSRICIGNSLSSLEPYRGCPLGCVYLIDALIKHPAFIPDKSVIGFCTGSTEFFLPELKKDLWNGKKSSWISVYGILYGLLQRVSYRGSENE